MNYQMNNQAPANKKDGLNGFVDTIAKFFPIIAIVFLGIGVLGLCYNMLMGLINSIGYSAFRFFADGFVTGISCVAKYAFYAVITLGLNKIIRK